jgi:RpiB/LacA/LacB family sugar-phosphate isomerase
MKIAIGCDHGGIVLKNSVKQAIADSKCEILDFGTFSDASCDYPDFAYKVGKAIVSGEADKGILLCGTGIGISIAANKIKGIRCAHVTDLYCAQMAAEHNNANAIALGGRITDSATAYEIVKTYLASTFAGGRHQARVDKIARIENGEAL